MSQSIKNTGVYQRLTSSTNELERMFKEVDEKKTPTDIKKLLLLMGLGTLSWISTYSGLLELIKANSGDIAFTYKLAIGFAVAMLMLMIVYILDQLFAPLNWLLRTIFIAGYIFLTIISVGFGFGFYWKFLESRSEATRSAESAVGQVQGALQSGQSRLEQLESTLTTLTALSTQKAQEERLKGNSCPNSRPGDGPRRRMRDNDAKSFSFAGDFVTRRAQAVATEIKQLNGDMVKISTRHPSTVDPATGTRNAFLKTLNQRLDLTITRFNAFRTDPQLKSIRNNLADRSNRTQFPDGNGGTFKCPDGQLQSALRGVVQAFDQLPLLEKPKIAAVEGSEATIEAFRRLAATLKGLAFLKMPPSEDEIREVRKKAVSSVNEKKSPLQLSNVQAGLNDRDYIPLSIAIFVDFCLLLVSINRPMDRLKSLVPIMKDARDGPISGILSSFHATHFAGIREEFSLFQHVVFDWGGHYYVAVPLASNDIQAQYLANLFVSLEGRGIVDRALIPPAFIVRGKLKKMGSSFAEHRAFRLYKFRAGAWSNIVLDAVMGAAKDVAMQTAEERTLEKFANGLPNHASENNELDNKKSANENLNDRRSANFASLFNDDMTQEDQQQKDGQRDSTNNQPVIDMPRLFRKESEQQSKQKQNNIITPATFHNNQPAGRSLNNPAHQNQQNSAHHGRNNHHLNGNGHNNQMVRNDILPASALQRGGNGQNIAPANRPHSQTVHATNRKQQEVGHKDIEQTGKPVSHTVKSNPFGLTSLKKTETADKPHADKKPDSEQQETEKKADILSWPKNETSDQTEKEIRQPIIDTLRQTQIQLEQEADTKKADLKNTITANSETESKITESAKEQNDDAQNDDAFAKTDKLTNENNQILKSEAKPQTHEKTKAISRKIAALQTVISENATSNKQQTTTDEPAQTATTADTKMEEEPELAHIAVSKITNWYAKKTEANNNSEPQTEKESEEI